MMQTIANQLPMVRYVEVCAFTVLSSSLPANIMYNAAHMGM
jgi:hypothetical protein